MVIKFGWTFSTNIVKCDLHLFMKGGFQCPTCKKSYGVKMGDMPDGSMTVREGRYSLPGHGEHNTIEITYSFSPGYHVSNGTPIEEHLMS